MKIWVVHYDSTDAETNIHSVFSSYFTTLGEAKTACADFLSEVMIGEMTPKLEWGDNSDHAIAESEEYRFTVLQLGPYRP